MLLKDNANVKWIGPQKQREVFICGVSKIINSYQKCIYGSLSLNVRDYVLILNVDKAEQDNVNECDVGRIAHLYESTNSSKKFRAIIEWFSRPQDIPLKELDRDDIAIDFDNEIIEDERPYDPDLSLDMIFGKCKVIYGKPSESTLELLNFYSTNRKRCPMFVCRYKFVKVQHAYRLVPIMFNDGTPHKSQDKNVKLSGSRTCSSIKKAKKVSIIHKPRRVSESGKTSFEFVDIENYCSNEAKVSPIKIVGGRYVVGHRTEPSNHVSAVLKKVDSARRNLNQSLTVDSDCDSQTECFNYSIVKDNLDTNETDNTMKIKLRLSGRRRSARLASVDSNANENFLCTPSKKSECIDKLQLQTPAGRKSILKSNTKKVDGTPKRSIQLSNIVEKKIFREDEAIATPKTSDKGKGGRKSLDSKSVKRSSPPTDAPSKIRRTKIMENIVPVIENREQILFSNEKDDLQLAREQLHVSYVPKSLPCREKEFSSIYNFLESKIEDECGGCIYISGVPGTGKTATVTSVINKLQRKVTSKELPSFDFLEINGMRLTEPRQAYVEIYRQLTGKTVSWEHAHALLEKRFSTYAPHRSTTVLLVDELDILCNRRQDMVYNLLDWPTKSASRLVVVTIANTMDLPERILLGKVTSRLGLTRLTFQPYTHKQLQEIVTMRLSGSSSFKSEAIQLVARKVAAVSGDARRTLDICRRATEIADSLSSNKENTPNGCVNIFHVQQAINEMIASSNVQAIKNCSQIEQMFLQAVVAEVTRTGVEETQFFGVYSQMETMAALKGITQISQGRALRICSKLGSQRLLICEHSRNDLFQKILLNVSTDDIYYALQIN